MIVSRPDDDAAPILEALLEDLDTGFAGLYNTYRVYVYTVTLRATGSTSDAEDLTAETFLRAYRSLVSARPPDLGTLRPRAWLLTIALNTLRNHRRSRARKPPPGPLENAPDRCDPGQNPQRAAEQNETARELAAGLATLPDRQREAVVLRHVLDLPIAEIAQVMDVPEGTAKSHVSRGLAALRVHHREADHAAR